MIIKPPRGARLNLSHPLARGLIGCWLFNEGTGDIVHDSSTNKKGNVNNDGIMLNMYPATDWVAGKDGFALDFDGVDDEIQISQDHTLEPQAITICSLVSLAATGDYRNIITCGDNLGYRIRVNSNNTIGFFDEGATNYINSTVTVTVNKYACICATGGAEGLKIYLDGVEVASNSVAYTAPTPGGNVLIGTDFNLLSDVPWIGKIAYVKIYNRALSASEIQQLYINPYQMFETAISPGVFGTLTAAGPVITQLMAGR